MTLYEINTQIENILSNMEIDESTGEVLVDTTLLESLQIAHDVKIENIACYIKNLKSDVEQLKIEEKNLSSRRKSKEKMAERLTNLLDSDLQGRKFETARCKVSYRKSTTTKVDEDVFLDKYKNDPFMCVTNIEYKYDKAELKKMIRAGQVIEGVKLVESNNISVK